MADNRSNQPMGDQNEGSRTNQSQGSGSQSANQSGNQSGNQSSTHYGSQSGKPGEPVGDNLPPLRDTGEGLLGDTSEDRHVSGSTTYRTLPDQGPQDSSRPEQEFPNQERKQSASGSSGSGSSSGGSSRNSGNTGNSSNSGNSSGGNR